MVPHWDHKFSKRLNKLFFFLFCTTITLKFDVGVPFGLINIITFCTLSLLSPCSTPNLEQEKRQLKYNIKKNHKLVVRERGDRGGTVVKVLC